MLDKNAVLDMEHSVLRKYVKERQALKESETMKSGQLQSDFRLDEVMETENLSDQSKLF